MLSLRYLVRARAADMRAANSDRVAAVALDELPADPATFVGEQKRHEVGGILRSAEPPGGLLR